MNFEAMSFGEAVSYVRTVGAIIGLLWLSIPFAAGAAIRCGKRNRPGTKLIFPRLVLWGWVVALLLLIAYFFSGAWYGENGPPPQSVAAQATVQLLAWLAGTMAVYGGLYATTQPTRKE